MWNFERSSYHGSHEGRIGYGGQFDEINAPAKVFHQACCHTNTQTGLASPGRTGQSHEPDIRIE
jgi:hypothetical protein